MLSERLCDPAEWEAFFAYRAEGNRMTAPEEADLRRFIDGREYEEPVRRLLSGNPGVIPVKKRIRKTGTDKKRVVYLYPRAENYVFKLLTFLMTREYDDLSSDCLFSFRANYGVCRAMRRLLSTPGIRQKYSYKADISDYFNSIPIERMLDVLKGIFLDSARYEPELYAMFEAILTDCRVWDNGTIVEEKKGVMAGTPFAVFFANRYLDCMDREIGSAPSFVYARYSDDIILFADSEEKREEGAARVCAILAENGLTVNGAKEVRTAPGEMWTFLGFSYENGTVDVAPISKEKLKAKIRRKARAIKRWQVKKKAPPENAVKAFIRKLNRKFFDADPDRELTWSRWYFPVITTDRTLKELDRYTQDWIRFLATDRHSAKKYGFRYGKMKELGYLSLVHAWYAGRDLKQRAEPGSDDRTEKGAVLSASAKRER